MKRPYTHHTARGTHAAEGQRAPVGGTPRVCEALPPRPTVVDDGVEFETVWYPHRDALSLLPEDCALPSTLATPATVSMQRQDHNQQDRWSWLG